MHMAMVADGFRVDRRVCISQGEGDRKVEKNITKRERTLNLPYTVLQSHLFVYSLVSSCIVVKRWLLLIVRLFVCVCVCVLLALVSSSVRNWFRFSPFGFLPFRFGWKS